MFSAGTTVSLKNTCLVELALIPNLCSSSPKVIPLGVLASYSTMKPVMFLSFSIRAKTIIKLQKPAFEIHIFCPLILYDLPSSVKSAVVLPELASEPAPGSVKQ